MKIRIVKRYYCDYCKKGMFRESAMRTHEEHCTLNPNRSCRMCDIAGTDNDLKALLAMMPKDVIKHESLALDVFCRDNIANAEDILTAFEKMKNEAGGCPACILAVIRQLNSTVYFEFDYKKEVDSFWKSYNQERAYSARDYY